MLLSLQQSLLVINTLAMLKKITVPLLLFFFCSSFINAQKKTFDKMFKHHLEIDKLTFCKPKSYFSLDSLQNYDPSPEYLHSSLFYSIKNKQNDIIIAFTMSTIREPNELLKKMFPKSQEVNSIMPYLITEADSSLSIPVKIDDNNLKKLNADNGYIYNMKIVYPYLNKYSLCKKVLIHKDNISNAEILYFYTKKDEYTVDQVIQETLGMLKFKN
jgi:hypothetical protein